MIMRTFGRLRGRFLAIASFESPSDVGIVSESRFSCILLYEEFI